MRLKRLIFYCTTFVAGICLQVMWPLDLSPFGVSPHFLLIATIYLALIRGAMIGEMFGFFWGLSADGMSVELFGSQAFLLTLVGYISGKLNRQLDESKPWAQFVFVFLISILYFVGLYGMYHIFTEPGRRIGVTSLILHPVINALLAPIIFLILRLWVQLWFPKSHLRLKL